MLSRHKTAVRPRRNLFGRPVRGTLTARYAEGLSRDELLDLLDRGYRLPILGGTSNQNQAAENPSYFPKALVVSTDQTIHQGDLVYWDGVNYTLKPLTSTTNVALTGQTNSNAGSGFCGCAAGTNVPGVYPNPPAGAPSENLPGIVVQSGGAVWLNTTTGENYNPWQPVTVGADSQTVTAYNVETVADRVGFVIIPAPVTPRGAPGATPLPETIAGPTRARVQLERKFPGTSLA
jgi:hypothetical protein